MAFGLALSGALRWGSRHQKTRGFLVPVGLNLAALAFLGAILAAGTEAGGLGAQWGSWVWPAGIAAGLGTLGFRFPRSVGLPMALVSGGLVWALAVALSGFTSVAPGVPDFRVQPLTDGETVTAFAWRADYLEPPLVLPLVPARLVRLRAGDAPPPEWWWRWAEAGHWGRSIGAPLPSHPMKFGVYRLLHAGGEPSWELVQPELAVPGD